MGIGRDYIVAFEQLVIWAEGLGDAFYLECFISGLKEVIQAHVRMHHPYTWLEACNKAIEVEVDLHAKSNCPNFIARACPTLTMDPTQTIKVQKVSLMKMVERRKHGLYYYCDEKYSPGYKCKEPKFFQIDASEKIYVDEAPSSEVIEEEESECLKPQTLILQLRQMS